MSRIEEGEADDNDSFLRACAFEANAKRALKGRKGQAVLKELEEALVALPQKRLITGVFADIRVREEAGKSIYERSMASARAWQTQANEARKEVEDLKLQVKRLQDALKHIIGFYGQGIDGSPEELAGKLAREALEAEGVKNFTLKRMCEYCHKEPIETANLCAGCWKDRHEP